jgi:4-aminobutyrate aminotransferase-like enzyme
VLENVRAQGAYAFQRLLDFESRFDCIGEVRGVGLMLGIEIIDPVTGLGDGQRALAIQRASLERGLILELGGRDDCVVRLLPPLNVTRETLDQALDILEASVASVSGVPRLAAV